MKEFNEVYLPVINFFVSLTGIVTLFLLIIQYKKDNHWKRLQSTYNFIGIGEEMQLQERLYKIYDELGIYSFPEESSTPFTEEQVSLITKNLEATLVTNMFLNYFQNLCIAYSFGLVEEDVFRRVHQSRIAWWYNILEPYISRRKVDYNNPEIWCEIVAIVAKGSKSV